jgi:hypothetical protein
MTTLSPRAQLLAWLGIAVAVRVIANVVTLQLGFQAVSDDDFARVAIGQSFANSPRWDASGTSWLPAPFWLTGSAMWLLGTSYSVARAVAWVTSLGSVVGFHWCCRAVGLRGAWLGLASCTFAVLPHAVWLGIATVPEGFVAVLTLVGLCTVGGERGERSGAMWSTPAMLGAACFLVATLSRYETWPAAVVAATYHGSALVSSRQWWRWPALILCLTGPLAWLLHGAIDHGDAWFFVKRVSSYRAALGATPKDWLGVLGNYPRALLVDESSATFFVLSAITVRLLRRKRTFIPSATKLRGPLVCGAVAMLAFLVWGDVTNGAPTHHPERTLLPCWLIAVLLAAEQLGRSSTNPEGTPTRVHATLIALCCLAFGSGLALQLPSKQFVDRSAELTLGATLAPNLARDARLWLETPGYGYVAVSVGTGQPWLVDGFNPGDPRQAQSAPPFEDRRALAAYLSERRIAWAVVPENRSAAFEGWALRESSFGSSLIFRIPASGAAENSDHTAD